MHENKGSYAQKSYWKFVKTRLGKAIVFVIVLIVVGKIMRMDLMDLSTKTIMTIAEIIAGLIFLLAIYAVVSGMINTKKIFNRNENLSRFGVPAMATIQSSKVMGIRHGRTSILVYFSFPTNHGALINAKLEIELGSIYSVDKYAPGAMVNVIYNPQAPTEVLIAEQGIFSQY